MASQLERFAVRKARTFIGAAWLQLPLDAQDWIKARWKRELRMLPKIERQEKLYCLIDEAYACYRDDVAQAMADNSDCWRSLQGDDFEY